MKTTIVLLILCLSATTLFCQETDRNVSSRVIQNVVFLREFQINPGGIEPTIGTGFHLEYKGETYLVTAKHFFNDDIKSGSYQTFDLFKSKRWHKFMTQVFFNENINTDVAILKGERITIKKPLRHAEGVVLGSETTILGFPNGWKMDAYELSANPFPIIKKGVVSAIFNQTPEKFMLADIINNKGYSGGPAVVYDYIKREWVVGGVVVAKVKNPIPEYKLFNEQGFTKIVMINEITTILDSIQ